MIHGDTIHNDKCTLCISKKVETYVLLGIVLFICTRYSKGDFTTCQSHCVLHGIQVMTEMENKLLK